MPSDSNLTRFDGRSTAIRRRMGVERRRNRSEIITIPPKVMYSSITADYSLFCIRPRSETVEAILLYSVFYGVLFVNNFLIHIR